MATFDPVSAARLKQAHPNLQKIMNLAIKKRDFGILSSQRGRADQEAAFRNGFTKVHFGHSAHNWQPAIALDIYPKPLNWKDLDAFVRLAREVIFPIAEELKIPIRWGGDWNRNGSNNGWDKPHYELYPWRVWAKKSKPFEG